MIEIIDQTEFRLDGAVNAYAPDEMPPVYAPDDDDPAWPSSSGQAD